MGKLMQEILTGYWDNEGGVVLSVGSGLDTMKREIAEQQATIQELKAQVKAHEEALEFIRIQSYGAIYAIINETPERENIQNVLSNIMRISAYKRED